MDQASRIGSAGECGASPFLLVCRDDLGVHLTSFQTTFGGSTRTMMAKIRYRNY
jgi:hypothetical protein